MEINKIKKAAEIAKSKTNDKRWINAIDKAVAGVESGWWIITELAHGVAVTTECGNTYFANGVCQCKAFANGQACKHRALARLIEIASQIEEEKAGDLRTLVDRLKAIGAQPPAIDTTSASVSSPDSPRPRLRVPRQDEAQQSRRVLLPSQNGRRQLLQKQGLI